MAQIRIFSDTKSGKVSFDGSTITDKEIGSVEALSHPTQSERIIIKSTRIFKSGSTTEYRVFLKRLKASRVQNKAAETLTEAPYNYTRDQVVEYLNQQMSTPIITEYFEYNPTTDRLEAQRDVQVNKNGFFLGEKHKMASGGSNIYFEDLDNKANSYPVFGEVLDQSLSANQQAGAGVTLPRTRIFQDFNPVPLGGNPVDDTAIPYDGDNFFPFNISGQGITCRAGEALLATQQLKYEIIVNGISVYVQYLTPGALAINDPITWYFDQPLDIEAGTTLRATIYKVSTVNNQEVVDGIFNVNEGDAVPTRYQTQVLARLFEDKNIALKEDVDQLLNGSIYKGAYDATGTGTPALPTGTDVLGDFYRVTAANSLSGYNTGDILVFNGTDYDHVAESSATQSDIVNSALRMYDIYVKAGYTGAVSDGSILYPFGNLETAVASANDGDQIYIEGACELSGEITMPNKSLFFYGADDAEIKFANYADTNANLLRFTGTDNTKEFKFKNITFKNAGGYALYIQKTAKVEIDDCLFTNNGWDGTALNTILPSTTTALLGYDSTDTDLQAFYAGSNASNGGAMRIEEATQLLVTGNTVTKNLRGIRVSDCGVGGGGVITRNQSSQNIESGIYLSVGALGGCQNLTVAINTSQYNANNGLLTIGGINNKFSQNEVNGNWNAGFCAWGAANTTLRDSGLYDNNRSALNGIGNAGDAKASIQINEVYNLLGTAITVNPAFRFIAEVLGTQVHYTGLGSNTEKIGFLISSAVGSLLDNDKNIIKVDDVGFIGQDYAIDLSEVDATNLRLAFGDNSFQSITYKAVKAPLAGNYSELPFSNHIMEVPQVDVVVDTLKSMITLTEGVGGNKINTYHTNDLASTIDSNNKIDIIQSNTDKIQLRNLDFGNIFINGVVAGNSINSANDSLNAAFQMDLVEYKEFLTTEVGVNGLSGSGGSLAPIANNWYISYGSQAGTQITSAQPGNNFRAYNPFYNGESLEQGHEFIWTHDPAASYAIGLWGAAEATQSGDSAIVPANWLAMFGYNQTTSRFTAADSSGVTIEQNGSTTGNYDLPNGQLALRFGQDNYLYLFEVVGGGYTLIGKSNNTVAGTSVLIQWAGYNSATFPVMTERTETWEMVHDLDQSEGGEWSNGIEQSTILGSRLSVSPGEKVTFDFNWQGRGERIGISYTGASNAVTAAQDTIGSVLFYNTQEVIKELGAAENIWDWNTDATNSYDPNGNQSDVGYWNGNGTPLGLMSFRYKTDNTLELWHETNNELIATKVAPLDGSAFNVYFGANSDNQTADKIPTLIKYDMTAAEAGANITGWYYIESPDGEFFYPLFSTAEEANHIDTVEGGSGTSHTHTFADEVGGVNTWYMPATNGVHAGTSAPQGGVFGNSINIVWNEILTNADSGYLPTFNNITYNVQEGSAINIQYKAAGMTDTFNVTNVPAGYADNGFAIIGTAEDITNGAGNTVQHVINVTKANSFGSVQGTITVNVLANLAGNEFTIIDKENGTIKFTQDGGITELDFSTVTFNAGSTYKFYLDHFSIESSDGLSVVDSSGNVLLGSEGLSTSGNSGDAGAYVQYVIPSDVAPGKFLRYYDNDTSAYYTDVPMTLAGSTYNANPTGITLEGPSANQTGSNVMDQYDHGWISLNETLAAGERLVLDNAFFTDFFGEVQGNNNLFAIGLRGDNWVNTREVNSNGAAASGGSAGYETFKGNLYIVGIWSGGASNVTMWVGANNQLGNNFYMNTSYLWNTACAFLEISADGNNIRAAIGRNNNAGVSQGDESTALYSDWLSYKGETGDQGFGITNLDVMMSFWTYNGGDIDGDQINWTGLTEVSVPVAPTTVTNWTKAVDFSGSNEHLKQVSGNQHYNPLRMNGTAVTVGLPDQAGSTVRSTNARPWATSIVFKSDGNNSNQHIWNSGEGAGTGDDNILLRVTAAGTLIFAWGREGSGYNECTIATNISSSTWYGVYIASTGARFNSSDATTSNLAAAFDIRLMSSSDSFTAVGSNLSTSSNWTSTGARMDRAILGDFTIGGRGSNRNFHGKVAAMVITNLRITVSSGTQIAMPSDAEIKAMITDPNNWEDDYREGQLVRIYNGVSTGTYSANDYNFGYLSNMIYLMGDSGYDTYSNGIRNMVRYADQNNVKLQFNSMQSNDIENVTIPGL